MFEKLFKLQANKTTVSREIMAGLVTFMTMAYIIFVNPSILSAGMAGVPLEAIAVATCLAAGIMTILMGIFSNYPLALASGMGLNAVLTFQVILGMKQTWQVAMGVVFIEGAVIAILVLTNFRQWVMNAIPTDLKRAIGVGIGLFIAFIGFKNAGLIAANEATLVALNKLGPTHLIALFGLVVTAFLMAKKVKGAILIGILTSTAVAIIFGLVKWPENFVTTIKPEYFQTIFALDIKGALSLGLVMVISDTKAPLWIKLPFHRLMIVWLPGKVKARVQPFTTAVVLFVMVTLIEAPLPQSLEITYLTDIHR